MPTPTPPERADPPEVIAETPARPPYNARADAETEAAAEPHLQAPLRRRSRVRATQVHLDEIAEEHLTELRKRAVISEVDLTASAVMRLALSELVDRHGYDRIIRMFAEDDVRLRRGRPRS